VAFVRSFVRRKSYVAIDAHHTFLSWSHVGRSEPFHGSIHRFDECQHRLLQLTFELWFMRLEPLPAIISPQAAQETKSGCTEVRFSVDVRNGRDHDLSRWETADFRG
jgi:hypothetical protein